MGWELPLRLVDDCVTGLPGSQTGAIMLSYAWIRSVCVACLRR
jgi:hypothetical protein